jgi:hypothetical protein
MTLLGIDTESGGISSENSLLTLSMSVVINYEIVDTLSLKVKPIAEGNRSSYFVQGEAMRVNGIDLGKHDLEAMNYKQASKELLQWIKTRSSDYGKLLPFGNGVSRDIELITKYILPAKVWEIYIRRNVIDLLSVGSALKNLELIPENQSLSLSGMAEFFGVKIDHDKIHTDEYDVWLGLQVLKGYNSCILGSHLPHE